MLDRGAALWSRGCHRLWLLDGRESFYDFRTGGDRNTRTMNWVISFSGGAPIWWDPHRGNSRPRLIARVKLDWLHQFIGDVFCWDRRNGCDYGEVMRSERGKKWESEEFRLIFDTVCHSVVESSMYRRRYVEWRQHGPAITSFRILLFINHRTSMSRRSIQSGTHRRTMSKWFLCLR